MSEDNVPTKTTVKTVVRKSPAARKSATVKVIVSKPEKKIKKERKVEDKVKVVRDSFTMPQADYDIIAEMKEKVLKAGLHVKKSELLRAGLQVLSALSVPQLKQTLSSLEKIKTGRPKKSD